MRYAREACGLGVGRSGAWIRTDRGRHAGTVSADRAQCLERTTVLVCDSECLSVCLFVCMARRGEWLGGIGQIDNDVPLGHAVHVLVHARGGEGAVQGAAAGSHDSTDSSKSPSAEPATATRGLLQLDDQVKPSISMNVVVEDMEKHDSTGPF